MRHGALGFGMAIATAGVIALPLTALAHSLPIASSPAQGSTVQQSPASVQITFGERPDPALSSIKVFDSAGASVTSGSSVVSAENQSELEVTVKGLSNGVYTVSWRTVSAIDGHLAAGSFAFGVGVSAVSANSQANATTQSPPPSPLALASRWLLLLSVLLLLGLVVTSWLVFQAVPSFAGKLAASTWVGVAVGSLGTIEAQREAAGISLAQLFASSLGTVAIGRLLVLWALAVAVAALLWTGGRFKSYGLTAAGIATLLALGVDVAGSHASAQQPIIFNQLVQLIHEVAAGVWLGGLAVLLLFIRGQPGGDKHSVIRRFSFMAGFCIVIVGATGVFRAVIEVESWSQLVSTTFGLLVLVKVGLFVILAALGAINRYRNVPVTATVLHGLQRYARTEVMIGVAVLAVTAALVNVAPPVSSQAAEVSARVVLSGSDFATTVRMQLVVTPGSAGFNTFRAQVTDYNSGSAIDASNVTLSFSNPLRAQVGESTLVLAPQGKGQFSANGASLSLNGIWEIAAIINRGVQSTEVDFQLTTDEQEPNVHVEPGMNGLPTLYTVSLTQQRTVQVYLDPGTPGDNEFHVTYFNAQGNELTMSGATVGISSSGSKPVILPTRSLDRFGHFVADANVAKGTTRFDVIGTTPDGEVLSTYVLVSVS